MIRLGHESEVEMDKEIKMDKEYEHVECPNCGYHWAVKEKDIIRCQFCMRKFIEESEG